jgi:DNA 3'-phosphatase
MRSSSALAPGRAPRHRIASAALASLLAAAAAGCATQPGSADPGGQRSDQPAGDAGADTAGDGGAGVGAIPRERRSLAHYRCPVGVDAIAVAFFDADSTLRVSKSGSVSANGVDDVNVLPFAAARIAELNEDGLLVAVVSNQGGVASGILPFEVAQGALAFTAARLGDLGARVDYFDMADKKDEFRKPQTGMALELDRRLEETCGVGVDLERSFMVGDSGFKAGEDGPHPDGRPADDFSNADRLFAENLGVPFHEPTDYFDWRRFGVFNIASEAELVTMLGAIEAEAARLEQDRLVDEAEALRREVEGNRRVNRL